SRSLRIAKDSLAAIQGQLGAMRSANSTAERSNTQSNRNAVRALALSEQSWRDSHRAFLELAKPDFAGEYRTHAGVEYQEPEDWWFMVTNRGARTSPNYLVERSCAAALVSEPATIPCAFKPHPNRPL